MKLKNDNYDGVYHLKNEAYLEKEQIVEKAEKPKKNSTKKKKGEK